LQVDRYSRLVGRNHYGGSVTVPHGGWIVRNLDSQRSAGRRDPARRTEVSGEVFGAAPRELLRASQAVADERRLRIIRLLAKEELTASELSARLAIGLTTVLHHLGLLLEARLLTASQTRRKVYRLRREGLADFDRALSTWLD